ncbi:AhpD family alkylhydroperoxidase [Scopulibacillus daqui]|uniref:AhpD family alkylhydroperoxidase n=1 Tax=Scopulibacillus daqui TaxID=1469162 RepID=A0ABS2Q2A5_9BACL|nr:AhpD family alkylhydroperoxidase [Scopulibacillus daqui]
MEKEHTSANVTEQIILDYKSGLHEFEKKMPHIADKYNEFTAACFKEGELDQKQKQLIALGISIYSQDEYCIVYHTKGCMDQGCTEKEILEAAGVTAAFGGGAAISQSVTLVQDTLDELNQMKH